jgi:adenosylcobyric acid synthase
MTGRTLMVQGTSSSAGKSLLAAALCRTFARRGMRVAPFKAQNMSNNAAVCADGAEIGRAQALQALAAGVAPEAAMNPILLKPEADHQSQVIVQGRPWKRVSACNYAQTRDALWPVVTQALDDLRHRFDLVVMEGAGSPVELNLRDRELVNMSVARYAEAPVLLVGDIDRGGIFAQLLGTLWLLEPAERRLVQGLVINKFRGDPALFVDGVRLLEEQGGVPVLGVVPWIQDLDLPEEDAVALESGAAGADAGGALDIAVIHLPRISNFNDFDPLRREPGVRLRYVRTRAELGAPHVVMLPGTKSTLADLLWLRERGLDDAIQRLAALGAGVVGLCGGYQMLGRRVQDPDGVESAHRDLPGLGLLPIETRFSPAKVTRQVQAVVRQDRHCPGCRGTVLHGYEIHHGRSRGGDGWLQTLDCEGEGAAAADGGVSPDGRIWGCYLHGLFDNDPFRRAWLRQVRWSTAAIRPDGAAPSWPGGAGQCWSVRVEAALDRLADTVKAALDLSRLEQIIENPQTGEGTP